MVSCTIIKTHVVFKILLALITMSEMKTIDLDYFSLFFIVD